MAIPNAYPTSNRLVRDALAAIPISNGNRIGDFVAPDVTIPAETVDSVVISTHKLDLDDLRAADAQAKQVRFGVGTSESISVVEHALKTTIDARVDENAALSGVNIIAERLALLREDILDAKEYRIAALVLTAANYDADHKDVTGLNFRTLDMQAKVDEWGDKIATEGGFAPDRAMISRSAWLAARQNASFREFAGGSDAGAGANDLTLANFAQFIGVTEVRIGDYKRTLANGAAATQFWTAATFLLFRSAPTISTRTLAATPVVPYGAAFGSNGQLVDARTAKLDGTEMLTEIGCYHRYKSLLRNSNLGFLVTGIVNT